MFAAEPFAVKLLNDIILQNHNPSCISGVKNHLQMMHNGVDLVVESDFLPYSKGFYIIYLHIYLYMEFNQWVIWYFPPIKLFFQKKNPVQVGSLEQWTCRHCTLGSIWLLSLILFIWIGGICDLSNWMHDIGIWCFPPNSFFF